MSCNVYIACKMTGRDKHEQHERARFVCEVLQRYGLTPVSPVIEEKVEDCAGKVVNHDRESLRGHWKRDKKIIRYKAHVVLLDHAEMKSFGMEREYCLSRGTLWKPTVILVPQGTAVSVAQFEDDFVCNSVHAAAALIQRKWGTRLKRVVWRMKMLNQSLPRWIYDQCYQWR